MERTKRGTPLSVFTPSLSVTEGKAGGSDSQVSAAWTLPPEGPGAVPAPGPGTSWVTKHSHPPQGGPDAGSPADLVAENLPTGT